MTNGAALKLTTARYYTPNDRSIQASGIVPDVESSNLSFVEKEVEDKFDLREVDLTGHLANESGDNVTNSNSEIEDRSLLNSDDQVREAINLLKSMVIALEGN